MDVVMKAALLQEAMRTFTRPNLPNPKQFWLDTLATNKDDIDEFRLLKTDKERFTHAFKRVLDYQTGLWFDRNCKQKDSKRSIRLREDGNRFFKNGQHKEAVREYTESVVYAKDSSEDLAWGYANRSAALYKLEKYDDCIKDIDRALNLKIPDRSKTGLYKRKGLCQKALDIPGFESSLQEAFVWLDKLGMSKEQMNKTRTKLKEECTSLPPATPQVNVVKYPVLEILSPSPEAPCASNAIAIKYSEKYGRHVVATRKIKPGELLILEKPYCSKLEEKNIYTHCAHCLQECWSLIPCRCCVYAAYCSEACKNEAWTQYHEVECPVVGYLVDYKFKSQLWISMKIAIMATQKGTDLDFLKAELETVDCNPDPRTKGFSDDEEFLGSQYRSVYSLSSTADKCSTEVRFKISLWVALTICIIARETDMFGKKMTLEYTLPTNPDIIFVGELMLKQLFICISNDFSYGSVYGDSTTKYAFGIVPVCSLLNHSCDPNTIRQWNLDHQAVYALFSIEQGEQIFDNYGACFRSRMKSERCSILQNWKFTCNCPPCMEDWPTFVNLPSYKEKHSSRQTKNNLDRIMRKLGSACHSLLQKSSMEKLKYMIDKMLKAIESLLELAKKPYKELYMVVAIVRIFYVSRNAMFDHVPNNSTLDITLSSEFRKRLEIFSSVVHD